MGTVFVPYVLLPETQRTLAELDYAKKEHEQREAESAKPTVVHLWHNIICSMLFRSCNLQRRWMRFRSHEQLVWLGLLNLTSNMQSPSTSLKNLTSHLAHPRRHLPYYTLPTHSPHDGTASLTSQHTKPKPCTLWTSQNPS